MVEDVDLLLRAVVRINVTDVKSLAVRSRVPQKFDVMQNYPNPFNGSTILRYKISERGYYSLRIIDATGRIVRTLVDQLSSPGQYQVSWNGLSEDGLDVPSGVYFGHFTGGGEEKTWKMILLR